VGWATLISPVGPEWSGAVGWATLISPVVPGGAVLCTRQVLIGRLGTNPVCFAEAEGGSSVGEQRGRGASAACAVYVRERGVLARHVK
jgi:hypothetical protein